MTIITQLAKYFEWTLTESAWSGNDLDGNRVQEKAAELGLITETQYDPLVHGEAEFGADPGDPWYVISDEVKAALKDEWH